MPEPAPGGVRTSVETERPARTPPLSKVLTTATTWLVGERELDDYMMDLAVAPDIMRRFAQIDPASRLKIMRSTYKTKPEHPEAWMDKCIATHWEGRGKRRSGPYATGAASGTAPAPARVEASPAGSQSSSWCGSSPGMPGSEPSPRPVHSAVPATLQAASSVQGSTRRQLFSPGSELAPPQWILEARKVMDNRGELLKLFLPQLQTDALVRLLQLPNEVQALLAASCLFNPISWDRESDYTAKCIHALESLDKLPGAPSAPSTTAYEVRLAVVTVGLGMGLGLVALHAVGRQQQTFSPRACRSALLGHLRPSQ